METGKVKFYNKEKKYGFITGDDGKDYFFHASGVSNELYVQDGDNDFRYACESGFKALF